MIVSLRHKGLKLLFEKDDPGKLNAEHVNRIRLILSALDAASEIEDMDQPTFKCIRSGAIWRAIGLSPFARIGGSYSSSPMEKRRMSILEIIIRNQTWA